MTLPSRRTLLLLVLPGWCAFLVAIRFLRTGQPAFRFLVWNLILAIVPLVASTLLVRAERRRSHALVRSWWVLIWILFLPNAPYILTDFVHLHPRPPAPLWFDIALMLSFAGTGLLLCYASLADVQAVVARRFGTAMGWVTAVVALLLCGFGIYAGRFLRWNSWDALLRPHDLATHIVTRAVDPGGHSRTALVTLIYGVGLALGYAAVRMIAPHGHDRPHGPTPERMSGVPLPAEPGAVEPEPTGTHPEP